jgi:uncharacterized alpha-E superfamily protein
LSSLVARFAENTYWLGRYLERAENLARILEINETYARDRGSQPSWMRVLDLYADRTRFGEKHAEATAQSVIHYYLLDRDNPSSIVSSIRAARENARSIRHFISTEMWTQINIFHSDVSQLQRRGSTVSDLSRILRDIVAGCQHFEGVAEGTFLRGEPWCFFKLGKYLERADQTTRILDMGYDRLIPAEDDAIAWVHWNVLLRSVSGYHAYRSRHPGESSPHEIAVFLLYDDEFPRALALCVNGITTQLRNLQQRHGETRGASAEKQRRRLEFLVETGPGKKLSPEVLHRYLDQVQSTLGTVSDAIAECYFDGD